MFLAAGTRLGGYEIVAALGAGAMGEVYRARELRLGRDIALKVLPPGVGSGARVGRDSISDPRAFDERHARFEREARALASLNHPNIAQIYGIVDACTPDGEAVTALAMELVEGRTLANAIPARGFPPARLLEVALELANALAAAHASGVVHRDLKPSNIMLRTDGHVKVLDFGLAKLRLSSDSVDTEASTAMETVAGRLMGTPAYMSPEQAEGRPVDGRSDLFSLGMLLYEAATGVRPFAGSSTVAILSAIVRDTPVPVTARNRGVPPALGDAIERLMEKDPDRRYQTADDLRAALEAVPLNGGRSARIRVPSVPRRLAWIAVGVAVAAAGLGVAWRLARHEPPLTIDKVVPVTAEEGAETHPSLSRDGNWVAYAASGDIFLRRVGTENPVLLTGDISLEADEPAFSPDGRWIAFSARRDGTDVRGGIWLMEAMGAGKRRLSDTGFSPAWKPSGEEIAYATEIDTPYNRPRRSSLSIIDVTSGRARQVGTEDGMEPAWSPSGRRLAYWALGPGEGARRDIFTRPAAGGAATPVTSDAFVDWGPAWSRDGRHLFFCSDRSGSPNLWRVRIDEETGRVLGGPEPVTTPASALMRVSFAADGSKFAYEVSDLRTTVVRMAFDPVAEVVRGEPVSVTSGTRIWADLDVSIDGRLALRSQRRQEDIYVGNADGTNITALAPDENYDRFPRWSPDGSRIAFSSTKGGEGYEIHSIRPDGGDLRRHTYYQPNAVHFPIWSPDGRRLAFTAAVGAGGQTYVIDPDGAWPTEPLKPLLTPPVPLDIRYRPWAWSQDGRRIVAYSERGAGMIVYDVATGAHEDVSRVGSKPRWLSDSRRLIYTFDGALHLLDTRTRKAREIFRPSAGAFIDPAVSRDDRSLYGILYRDEGSIWVATVK